MLPDYVKTKSEVQGLYNDLFEHYLKKHSGPISEIRSYKVFEGENTSIIRPEGHEDITQMQSASSTFELKYDEVPSLTLEKIAYKLESAAKEMADQQVQHFYETISKAVESAGNTVSGGPLTAERILEVMETIQIDFDKNGQATLPQIHIGPEQEDLLKREFSRLETEPDLKDRWTQVMFQHRENWRARENSRKLVG